jgi:hypothetical protein
MVWSEKDMKFKGLSDVFSKTCSNEAYMASLNSSDAWHDVEEWCKFKTHDGYCFDLLFLIKVLSDQLNNAKNSNPYPIYPMNIFTRVPLNFQDLNNLDRRIKLNCINVSLPLSLFLKNKQLLWSEDVSYTSSREWRDKCIDTFEKFARFKRYMKDTNDIDSINGIWVDANEGVLMLEGFLNNYLQTADEQYINKYRKHAPQSTTIPMEPYYLTFNPLAQQVRDYYADKVK